MTTIQGIASQPQFMEINPLLPESELGSQFSMNGQSKLWGVLAIWMYNGWVVVSPQ